MTDYTTLRKTMVESQVRTNDVTDRRVLRAMLELPREAFVPEAMQVLAYSGDGVSLGGWAPGRSLPAAVVTARLVQLASLDFEERVLEIGCASGYGTAILSQIAKSVTGIESDPVLAAKAQAALAELGRGNVTIKSGALAEGDASGAPYDVIIVSGTLPDVPAALRDQLREGGRLIAIIAEGPIGRATVYERVGNGFSSRYAFDAEAPALPGFDRKPVFSL